jgi:fused signal recognition particle receptor
LDALVLIIIGASVFLILMMVLVGGAVRRRGEADFKIEAPPTGEEALEEQREAMWDQTTVEPEADKAPVDRTPQPIGLVEPKGVAPAKPKLPIRKKTREAIATRLATGLTRSRLYFSEKLAGLAGREKLTQDDWDEIEEALIRADVGVEASVRIVRHLRQEKILPADLKDALGRELVSILDRGDRTLRFAEQGPTLWLVTGVNGTGKTTSIAKMAYNLQEQGRSVVLAAADTFRAAAIDQLGTWADRLGVHMVRHAPGADPGAVVFDALEHAKAREIDVVIADTAGRLHTKSNLMEELKKIRRVAERQVESIPETLLVLDATVGQNGIAQAETFKEAVDISGIVLTKLDGTARGGVIVAVQEKLGIPVKLIGVGESLEDLEPFDPQAFTQALLAA